MPFKFSLIRIEMTSLAKPPALMILAIVILRETQAPLMLPAAVIRRYFTGPKTAPARIVTSSRRSIEITASSFVL